MKRRADEPSNIFVHNEIYQNQASLALFPKGFRRAREAISPYK